VKGSIDDQGRILAPARDQFSEATPLSVPYAEGGAAAGDL